MVPYSPYNNMISQLNIPAGLMVTTYTESQYLGDIRRVFGHPTQAISYKMEDTAILHNNVQTSLNNHISSFKIEPIPTNVVTFCETSTAAGEEVIVGDGPVVPSTGICVEKYVGNYAVMPIEFTTTTELTIISLTIPQGMIVEVFDEPNFTGTSKTFRVGNIDQITRKKWNERIQSYIIGTT